RLADAAGKLRVTSGAEFGAERAERFNDPENRAEQSQHRRDHPDIGEKDDTIVQAGSDARSFSLRDLAHLLEIRARIFRGEIEHLLHDPGDGFTVAIRNREETEIIALTQKRVRRCHVTARDDGAAPDG